MVRRVKDDSSIEYFFRLSISIIKFIDDPNWPFKGINRVDMIYRYSRIIHNSSNHYFDGQESYDDL